ncbi:uncharacterized protein LOC112351624 [Selaginella moellendorffii]|uniref:uncharacterized protein LOC112351624 n=1 Tax=Selaginella moellendorffii TaxID=88036 RepID=UPI000D1C4536|nr:uncharacterized protein LOC112351624 [Selaginella moellendorffii]|eukprot:XP_024545615.1 uncharacterized protein LOC112351624 [Selaginella moellendorffii]
MKSRGQEAAFLCIEMAASESPAPQVAENFPDCHGTAPAATGYGWLSPRISFSTDFGVLAGKDSPRREEASGVLEWSTEFEFSLSIECPGGSPADEIFCEGKLLPLQLLPSSHRSPILLVKELLEEESGGGSSRDRSCASSGCASPLIVKSASFPPGSPTVVLPAGRGFHATASSKGNSSKSYYPGLHTLKLVTLFFRRQLGRTPPPRPAPVPSPSGDGNSAQPGDTTPSVIELTRSSSTSSSGNSRRRSKSTNSGRILWMNLERCSRKNADQSKNRRRRRANPGDKTGSSSSSSGAPGSFSSSVRVAPVLNVPMCMGPVRETKSTLAGLRKLFHGRKAGLQRVTWACPGGAV